MKITFVLEISDDAVLDIQNAYVWYKAIHPELAANFEEQLDKEIQRVIKNPNSYSDKYKKVKVVYLKKFPFGIHYLMNVEQITMIGLFHTSQNPIAWKKRYVKSK